MVQEGAKLRWEAGSHGGLQDLAERCMDSDPEARPDFARIMAALEAMDP